MAEEVFISYDVGDNTEPFQEWLHANLPSTIGRTEDAVDWISVSQAETEKWIEYHENTDVYGLIKSWEQLCDSKRPINFQSILELASNYWVTCGKWLFYAPTGPKIDYLWEKVATGIINDDSKICHTAKVSTNHEDGRHVVCIYNTDFRDKAQVMELERAIRNMGIKCTMKYKPDVYTYTGVYRKNPWGLKPTIMESMYDIKTGNSVITSDVFEI